MNWAEISIHTTHEATEAVAAIFHELGAGGVIIEDPDLINSYRQSGNWTDCIFPEDDGILHVKVIAYLPSDKELVEKLKLFEEKVSLLADYNLDKGTGKITWREVNDGDWADQWKQYFHTSRIGERILIKPTWEEYKAMPGDVVVEIDPGAAFGTGTHQSTILCLECLEKLVKEGDVVFDVGTGSGILAIAAAKLGATEVRAGELDALAVDTARQNVAQNHLEDIIKVYRSNLMQGLGEGQADIVIANIIADIIIPFTPDVPARLKTGGHFVVSGIIKDRLADVTGAITSSGLTIERIDESGEWVALTAIKAVD